MLDRKELISAPAIKGKSAIPLKYGKDRMKWIEAAFLRGKPLLMFYPYVG